MPIGAKYVLMVSMDVAPEKEELFNEVYDQEHVPNLLAVPGVLAATRVRSEPFALSRGVLFAEVEAGEAISCQTGKSYRLVDPICEEIASGGRTPPSQ